LKLVKKGNYIASLKSIVTYISQDKPKAALDFLANIDKTLHTMLKSPYMYRKSIYFDDECYRDFIYKGYTIIYKIDFDTVFIIEIFKWKNR